MAIVISSRGYRQLEAELAQRKERRPEIIQAIKEAREQGDLRENAGYDAAREEQGMNEAHIKEIESRLAQCTVIDLDKQSGKKIVFGATCSLIDIDTDEKKVYTILGPDEANLSKGLLSYESPLGDALLGHVAGDEVTIKTAKGETIYEIEKVEFLGNKVLD